MTAAEYGSLRKKARDAREHFLRVASKSSSTHVGSSLSEIDILTALYGGGILNVTPATVGDPGRDRFILSKGHGALGFYVILAQNGFIREEDLERYGHDGTALAGHPVYASAPGIEATSGSLGHALPMGVGMALSFKRDRSPARVFVLLSDGEMDEGSNWEAILLAGHLKLDNLIAIVDYNKIQSFGRTKEVLDLDPLPAKWAAAHWSARELDGHRFEEVMPVCSSLPLERGKPTVIIAHTIKGKGVPSMEGKLEWHYRNVKPEDLPAALRELY